MPHPDPAELTIPRLTLPFPAREHPQAQEISDDTDQWMRDVGLIDSPEREKHLVGGRISHWFPSLVEHGDPEALQVCGRLVVGLTLADDWIAEGHGARQGDLALAMTEFIRHDHAGRLLECGADAGILPNILRDLIRQLRTLATADQVMRYLWLMSGFYLAISTESAHMHQKVVPALADYRRLRGLSSAMEPCFVLSEFAHGVRTPLETVMRPEALKLSGLVGYLGGAANDLIGLRRDLSRGDTWSPVHFLTHHEQCTYQEAVSLLVDDFYRHLQDFTDTADALRAADPQHAAPYIEIAQNMLAGHTAWTYTSARYTMEGWHDPVQPQHLGNR